MIAFGPGISACPSCSSTSFRIGGREIEPARKVQAVTVPVPFENQFVELEGPRQELTSIANDLLHALPEFFETRWFQSATPP